MTWMPQIFLVLLHSKFKSSHIIFKSIKTDDVFLEIAIQAVLFVKYSGLYIIFFDMAMSQ